jgi:hypothetical protein
MESNLLQLSDIINVLCAEYDVLPDIINQKERISKRTGSKSKRSPAPVAKVKQLVCYLDCLYLNSHYKVLMNELGYINHSKISKNVRLVIKMLSVDKGFQEEVERLIERLNITNLDLINEQVTQKRKELASEPERIQRPQLPKQIPSILYQELKMF